MSFLNFFADTLHQHNLTLSVFISGCCGFVDPAPDRSRVTGCVGAESNHDCENTSYSQHESLLGTSLTLFAFFFSLRHTLH